MSTEWHRNWMEVSGIPGGRKDSITKKYLKENTWFAPYYRGMLEGYGFAVAPEGFAEKSIIFQKIVIDYLGQILYDDRDVVEAMNECQKELIKLKREMKK